MYRIILLFLALTLLPVYGLAEDAPLSFADDLTGVYTWPEESSEAEASYVYRYSYPQVAGGDTVALTINNVFQYEASDALGFECPMIGSSHPAEEGQMQVNLTYTITHMSEDFLSVRIDKEVTVGSSVSRIIKAFTFTLTGNAAGTVVALPYILGLINQGETDEWYIDRQTAKADECARDMVWLLIETDMKADGSQIWGDLTFEELEWGFYPEEDFYLDEEGNFVFFIQENMIAPTEAGQYFYTITLDEMLDEI